MGRTNNDTSWDNANYRMLIKIKPGTNVDVLLEKMNQHFPDELKKNSYGVTGYTRFYLEPITSIYSWRRTNSTVPLHCLFLHHRSAYHSVRINQLFNDLYRLFSLA